jgi:hypothetical protein
LWRWHQAKNRVTGTAMGQPCVLVADGDGEEFEEAPRGLVARGDHHRWRDDGTRVRRRDRL